MDRISIFIPVFEESDTLDVLLNNLINDTYENKEIITVIDEPTKNSLETVKKYGKQVKFILNKKRKGKVDALNEATRKANGDIFFFIDSDCVISKKSKNLLRKLVKKMENVDLLDVKKNVIRNKSIFSKMFTYESLTGSLTSWMFSKLNLCLGICGQAFAIKSNLFKEIGGFKNVIAEDLEIGIQSYLREKKYSYLKDVELYSKTPSSWKGFLKQRKRWGSGAGLHFKTHWRAIFKEYLRHPTRFLLCLFYFWPTAFSLISLFLIDSVLGQIFILSLISLSLRFTFLMPIMLVIGLGTALLKNILLFLLTYLLSAVAFFIASRKLNYTFKGIEFTFYYIIYSPLSFFIYNYHFFKALLSRPIKLEDWKV